MCVPHGQEMRMPSLASLLEDYRNWRGRQEWESGKGWQDFYGGDPDMQERMERFQGFGTGSHGVGGLAGIFVGSKGAANLGKSEIMSQAEQAFNKGEIPYSAWREHQITRFPHDKQMRLELDDSNALVFPEEARHDSNVSSGSYQTTLSKLLEHPRLFQAYPDLKDFPVVIGGADFRGADGAEGTANLLGAHYRGDAGYIGINPKLESDPKGLKSTLLHEVQHEIQDREGFAQGSMPQRARAESTHSLNEIVNKTADDAWQYHSAKGDLSILGAIQRARKYDEMTGRSNIRPRAIHSLADWYSHSDEIRSSLGPMPKKAGEERDKWMRSAFGILRDKQVAETANEYQNRPYMLNHYGKMDDKQVNSGIRKAERRMDKHREGAIASDSANSLLKRLRALDDYEVYRRSGGEGEARLTQDRMDLTPDERAQMNPLGQEYWGGVPMRELWNFRR